MYRLAVKQEYIACNNDGRLDLSHHEEEQEPAEEILGLGETWELLPVNFGLEDGYEDYSSDPHSKH